MPIDGSKPLVIWRFTDGRKGHEKQTQGLIHGIKAVSVRELLVQNVGVREPLSSWKQLPKPNLLVGAGQQTHVPVLVAKLLFGGKTIVLMKPSLPTPLFDLVFLPHHDRSTNFGNVHTTLGVLTPIPQVNPLANKGSILLGGPSRHFEWETNLVLDIVHQICISKPETEWSMCDSPRTPETALSALAPLPNVKKYPWQETNASFLTNLLNSCSENWVTCDSVTMLYEALNTGAPLGIIELKSKTRNNKLLSGIQVLAEDEKVQLSSKSIVLSTHQTKQKPGYQEMECARKCLDIIGQA